jgi:hypothetical protein
LTELTTKSSLSPPQRQLVELMQTLNFARIEALHVRDGQPSFDPAPRVIRKLKMGGDNGPRPEASCEDFRLKRQTIEMLETIGRLSHGEVLAIEVKNGLPFSIEIEKVAGCGHD